MFDEEESGQLRLFDFPKSPPRRAAPPTDADRQPQLSFFEQLAERFRYWQDYRDCRDKSRGRRNLFE